MILATWLLSLPFRLLAALGLRRSVILACLFVLAVTAYGVAEDLGLVQPPAQAAPARRPAAGQPRPSRAAMADIPAGYLRRYQAGAGRCPGLSWAVLAAIGKVESDHGRSRLPGVRSGWNVAGAAGPILRLTPFIEQMGPTRDGRKEFWWEREWRRVGDLGFNTIDIVVVSAPEDEHRDIRERLAATDLYGFKMPAFVDARWGLERMIGAMAGVRDIGPFPS